MNYRHIYYAGNFADVFKHWILTLTLQAMRAKDAALFYMDTHAGAGRHDLSSEKAQKTAEYRGGIERLVHVTEAPEFQDYVTTVRSLNPANRLEKIETGLLRAYPGSALVVARLTRAQDRLVLLDSEPQTCAALRSEFVGDRRVSVHQQDALLGIEGFSSAA